MKTEYEKARLIRHTLLTRVGESLSYKTWKDDLRLSNIAEIPSYMQKLGEKNKESFKVNPTELSQNEMADLGFGRWEDGNPMMLIPIWLYPFLAETFPYESIGGRKGTNSADMDNDQRFGMLAYGVIPRDAGSVTAKINVREEA